LVVATPPSTDHDGARRFAGKSGGSQSRNKAAIQRNLLASIHQNSPTRLHETHYQDDQPDAISMRQFGLAGKGAP
jgi:hypothetical protein